jgi:hypothetical protein
LPPLLHAVLDPLQKEIPEQWLALVSCLNKPNGGDVRKAAAMAECLSGTPIG